MLADAGQQRLDVGSLDPETVAEYRRQTEKALFDLPKRILIALKAHERRQAAEHQATGTPMKADTRPPCPL